MINYNTFNTKLTEQELAGLYRLNRNKDDMPQYFYIEESYYRECRDLINEYLITQSLLLMPDILDNSQTIDIKYKLTALLIKIERHTDEVDFENIINFFRLKYNTLLSYSLQNEFYEAYLNLKNIDLYI